MWHGVCVEGGGNRHWKVKGTIADSIPLRHHHICKWLMRDIVYVYGWGNEHEEDCMGILTMY